MGRNRARPKPPGDGKWTSSFKSSVGAAAPGGLSSGTGRDPVRGFYAGEGLCPGLSAGSPASLGKRAGTEARPYRRYDRCKVPVPTLILRNKCVNRHGQKNGPQPASPVLIPPQTRRIAAEQEKFLAYQHSLNFHPQAGNKKDTGLSPYPRPDTAANPTERFAAESEEIPTAVQFSAEPETERRWEFLSWCARRDLNPHVRKGH